MAIGRQDNLSDNIAWIQRVVDTFDFTRPGAEGSLGRDLAVKVAEEIKVRSGNKLGPDGQTWPDNEARYAAYKTKRYQIVDQPNVRTGQMLNLISLLGETEITPDQVIMKYGRGEAPVRTAAGVPLSKADSEITDIEKAYFCSKDRPFYALDDKIADELQKVAQESLDHLIAES